MFELPSPESELEGVEFEETSFRQRNAEAFAAHVYPKWQGQPINYLEIGTGDGMSGCWMVKNVLTQPVSNALFLTELEGDGVFCLADRFHKSNPSSSFTVLPGSRTGLGTVISEIRSQSVDLCYISGLFGTDTIAESLIAVFPLLKIGAWLIVDDPDVTFNPKTGHIAQEPQKFLRWLDSQKRLTDVVVCWKEGCLDCFER